MWESSKKTRFVYFSPKLWLIFGVFIFLLKTLTFIFRLITFKNTLPIERVNVGIGRGIPTSHINIRRRTLYFTYRAEPMQYISNFSINSQSKVGRFIYRWFCTTTGVIYFGIPYWLCRHLLVANFYILIPKSAVPKRIRTENIRHLQILYKIYL